MTTTTTARERTVMNITFHGVGPQPRVIEAGEDRVWMTSARFVEILDTIAQHDEVAIMFDDGNASDVRAALPALLERGLDATFFVVAGRLGTPHFLDEDDVRLLADRGMTIGSHGMRHRSWRNLDDRNLGEELGQARRRLEGIVGAPVSHAACPFGAYDRRVLGALRGHGYERVFTSDGGATCADRWLQARTSLGKDHTAADVERMLSADTPALALLRAQAKSLAKRWR
jgi:peptidoglycan/xylan/chitin deacetylase (PgdA/CDA1 family)